MGNPLAIPHVRDPVPAHGVEPELRVSARARTRRPGYDVSNIPPDPQFSNYPSITETVNKVSLVDITPNVAKLPVIEAGLPGSPAVAGSPNSRYVLLPAVMNGHGDRRAPRPSRPRPASGW